MVDLVTLPVLPEHVSELAQNMRGPDRREVMAMGMVGPDGIEGALCDIVERSFEHCRTAVYRGRVACIYGVTTRTAISREGHPWMLGTGVLDEPRAKALFVRRCKPDFLKVIPPFVFHLWNYTDSENSLALGWLQWMGFSISDDTIRFNGVDWRRFDMRAE